MARLTRTHPVGALELYQPRDDVVLERSVGPGRFEVEHGPFRSYRRTLTEHEAGIDEEIEFRVAAPYWSWLLTPLVRRALANPPAGGRQPAWAPPERLSRRSATVLGLLTVAAAVAGYLATLVGQTMTFAADEFGSSDGAQGVSFAVIRLGVAIALVMVAIADRRGRRVAVIASCAVGIAATATGALAPSLAALTATQLVGRSFATALGIVVPVVAAEEVPARTRAWSLSVLAMTTSLGAGLAVLVLPLADLGVRGWRLTYLIPLVAVPLVIDMGRRLPETQRFEGHRGERARWGGHRRALVILAIVGFATNLLVAPAAQFRNGFLADERGFSATEISLFVLVTSTPGGLGLLVGGRLADTRGRRALGGLLTMVAAILVAAFFLADGPSLWVLGLAGTLAGAMAAPAVKVFEAELFPTNIRTRAGGVLAATSLAGSVCGLVIAGLVSDRTGSLATGMIVLAAGPLVAGWIVWRLLPETAGRSLEELNPEDLHRTAPDGAADDPGALDPGEDRPPPESGTPRSTDQ